MDKDLNTYLSPEVAAFAVLMEDRLRFKAPEKGGDAWKLFTSVFPLLTPLTGKFSLLVAAVLMKGPDILKQAIDVANYLMMVLDVLKKLTSK